MNHPLRAQLPRTYQAFLGRFERPTEVQQRAVPILVGRRDALLCAPTASGKTEAYAAPAVELLLSSERAPFSLLVISPTRALANDLKRRLDGRMHEVGVAFGRFTGEHKERIGAKFPEAVVTTPEGLDSLIHRRPRELTRVRAVVLDELHVLDGTPRGDQLRVLLHRLDRAAIERPQRIAASATVGDPLAMAARYLTDPEVVAVEGGRALKYKSFTGATVDALAEHVSAIARGGFRKVLIFCNAREAVEKISAGLLGSTPFQDRVFAHHGSLSRTVRERTERQFLDAPAAVCVSTMTLELGIDIGSVDYVLLAGPPHDIASLMQRVGRGARRANTMRVGCACANPGEELLIRTMLKCGVRGELHERPYAFRTGVLVQQAMCIAGAHGHVDARRLELVTPPELHEHLGEGFATSILETMFGTGLLSAPRGGRYVLEPVWEERYEQGKLHSNFSDPPGLSLVDRLTGEVIGHVQKGTAGEGRIRLGGTARRAVMQSGGRVLTDRGGSAEAARYRSDAAPATSFGLAREVVASLGAGEDELLGVPAGAHWCLVHGLGTLGGLLLAEALGAGVAESGAYCLYLTCALEEDSLPLDLEIEDFLIRHDAKLARFCGMGRFHAHLPGELQREALRDACGLDPVVDFLRRARLRILEPGHPIVEQLREL